MSKLWGSLQTRVPSFLGDPRFRRSFRIERTFPSCQRNGKSRHACQRPQVFRRHQQNERVDRRGENRTTRFRRLYGKRGILAYGAFLRARQLASRERFHADDPYQMLPRFRYSPVPNRRALQDRQFDRQSRSFQKRKRPEGSG